MGTTFQLTIDCADPGRMVRFWALALHYRIQPPPDGFDTWNAFYRGIGVPEDELPRDEDAVDRILDPDGTGQRIWFQQVPEEKAGKNRLHLDLLVSDGRSAPLPRRRAQVDAEVRRLVGAGASVYRVHDEPGVEHYAVTLLDPEGNEFCVV